MKSLSKRINAKFNTLMKKFIRSGPRERKTERKESKINHGDEKSFQFSV